MRSLVELINEQDPGIELVRRWADVPVEEAFGIAMEFRAQLHGRVR